MAAQLPYDERLLELLSLRAIEGLDDAEQEEVQRLGSAYPEFDAEELDRAAAALVLAGLRPEPMPATLRARVEADAEAYFARGRAAAAGATPARASSPVTPMRARPQRPQATAWGGWIAAAAALVIAVTGWLQVDRLDAERKDLGARQAALQASVNRLERTLAARDAELAALREAGPAELLARLQAQPGTVVLPWATTGDAAAVEIEGAVVWNAKEQAGVMRLQGLAANDPRVAQYQLWIFDAERDDRFPVDGGVFDVPAGAGEALVPIQARLPVGKAVLFAITVETPGGVVVSSRDRIALVAQPEA